MVSAIFARNSGGSSTSASVPNALMLEWDQNPNGLRSELLKEELRLEGDSTVRVPERPGLGIELDRGAVELRQHDPLADAHRL